MLPHPPESSVGANTKSPQVWVNTPFYILVEREAHEKEVAVTFPPPRTFSTVEWADNENISSTVRDSESSKHENTDERGELPLLLEVASSGIQTEIRELDAGLLISIDKWDGDPSKYQES